MISCPEVGEIPALFDFAPLGGTLVTESLPVAFCLLLADNVPREERGRYGKPDSWNYAPLVVLAILVAIDECG
jgi:hypothetical protein